MYNNTIPGEKGRCSSVSTPSAMTSIPRALHMTIMVRTITSSLASVVMSHHETLVDLDLF